MVCSFFTLSSFFLLSLFLEIWKAKKSSWVFYGVDEGKHCFFIINMIHDRRSFPFLSGGVFLL